MKIRTNFAAPVRAIALRAVLSAWVLAAVWGVGAVALWLDASTMKSDVRESAERLAQLEARRAAINVRPNAPSAAELAALRARVATVNTLSATNGRRVVPLLALLEELLPPEAWLMSVTHKARDGEVVLIAEAERADHLTQFLLNLEKSSRFSEVLLVRQTPLGAEGRRTVQFELRLKERG